MDRRKEVLLDLHPDKASLNNLTEAQKTERQEKLKRSIVSFNTIREYIIQHKLDDHVEQVEEWEEIIVIEDVKKYQKNIWQDHKKVNRSFKVN